MEVRSSPRLVVPLLAAALLAPGCRKDVPEGWAYVTRVTTTEATVVWSGPALAGVRCIGRGGEAPLPKTIVRPRGLRSARLKGLLPDSPYVCRIEHGRAGLYPRIKFRTAPSENAPFTFAVVGDSGDGSPQAAALARRVLAGRPAFLIHLGDMAYGYASRAALDGRFFHPYRRTLARVPLFPTPGNHDLHRHSVYRAVFAPTTSDDEPHGPHYAFDWGSAHFVSVSSTEFSGTNGAGWLADDLASARARPWRIVFLHEPVFGPGGKWVSRGLRGTLEPIVEAGRVDLLLAGHEHLYERGEPACAYVRDAAVLPIVSGGGGAALDRATSHPNFPRIVSATHYLRIAVTRDWLDVRAITPQGKVLDRVRLRRDSRPPCRSGGWPRPREKSR
jgi:Calcineurin-like phosphoesterase